MLWNTVKYLVIVALAAGFIGTMGILFIRPLNTYAYFIGGHILGPVQEEAARQALALNESNLTYSANALNIVNEEDETHAKLWEGSQNTEKAWMLFTFICIAVATLFYTGWTERKVDNGGPRFG